MISIFFQQIKYIIHTRDGEIMDFDNGCRKNLKLIDGLHPDKAHGHDGISIIPTDYLKVVYKTYLYYGDVIYDQTLNESFSNNIETVEYNAAIAITKKLYELFGLESLQQRRWIRRLCLLCKVF